MANQPLTVTIQPSIQFPQISNYKVIPDVWKNENEPYQVYWNQQVYIWDIQVSELKGAHLIMTGADDWDETASDFLNFVTKQDIEDLYIAYDSRANQKPDWLTKNYWQVKNDLVNQPLYLVISMLDKRPGVPKQFVKLEVWRKKVKPTANQIVTLEGNSYDSPDWGNIPLDNRAMYLVFIKPEQKSNCSIGHKVDTLPHKDCYFTEAEAITKTTQLCNNNAGPYQCRNITCTFIMDCASAHTLTGGALKISPMTSEIEFIPPSKAAIHVKGKQYQSSASGHLQFDYHPQTMDLELQSMLLNLAPFQTDIGTFSENKVAMLNYPTAKCTDTSPVFGQPCDTYQIPAGEFIGAESAKHDGKTLLWNSENVKPLDISIDHIKRTFDISGTIQTTITLNGQPAKMDIIPDLEGRFVSFSPKAVGIESTKYAECQENTNATPVYLNAAGSFDVYAPSPANLPKFEWYEDYGTATEHLWGSKAKVEIKPYQLGYGVHAISLLVEDTEGLVDVDNFNVEVGDSVAPDLTIPADIETQIYSPGTNSVYIDIGKASAKDACASEVMVTNDAPENQLFKPGITMVTWQADDGRGNVTTAVQKINVRVLAPFPTVVLPAILLVGLAIAGYLIFRKLKKA